MLLDGKKLATGLLEQLRPGIKTFTDTRGQIPKLAVILVGDDMGSLSYIRQKEKATVSIGAQLILEQYPATISISTLEAAIQRINADDTIQGLIIQRPVPIKDIPTDILQSVAPQKDIDGFVPNSPFPVPVAMAVLRLLETSTEKTNFVEWLRTQQIVILGRGETAGAPIAKLLQDRGAEPLILHSQSTNQEKVIKDADIIISCVGKPHIITADMIKPNVRLISVGLSRDTAGNLHGDYEAVDIEGIASWYTPTPGGVGPVNVACLMENFVKACTIAIGGKL